METDLLKSKILVPLLAQFCNQCFHWVNHHEALALKCIWMVIHNSPFKAPWVSFSVKAVFFCLKNSLNNKLTPQNRLFHIMLNGLIEAFSQDQENSIKVYITTFNKSWSYAPSKLHNIGYKVVVATTAFICSSSDFIHIYTQKPTLEPSHNIWQHGEEDVFAKYTGLDLIEGQSTNLGLNSGKYLITCLHTFLNRDPRLENT